MINLHIGKNSLIVFERGYQYTSMQQTAERCGLTKGTMYRHFDSKDDLCENYMRCTMTGSLNPLSLFK